MHFSNHRSMAYDVDVASCPPLWTTAFAGLDNVFGPDRLSGEFT